MKIIIIATFSLLIAGLIISFQSMKKNEITDPRSLEIERLENRIAQLENAQQQTTTELGIAEVLKQETKLEEQARAQAAQAELERTRQELARLKNENEEKEALIEESKEALAAPIKPNGRANLIVTALVMARVNEFSAEANIAGINIEQTGSVNTGDVLGIRRNSGIIGRVMVGRIDMGRAIADPIPGSFLNGQIDIQVGDELILPPQY